MNEPPLRPPICQKSGVPPQRFAVCYNVLAWPVKTNGPTVQERMLVSRGPPLLIGAYTLACVMLCIHMCWAKAACCFIQWFCFFFLQVRYLKVNGAAVWRLGQTVHK